MYLELSGQWSELPWASPASSRRLHLSSVALCTSWRNPRAVGRSRFGHLSMVDGELNWWNLTISCLWQGDATEWEIESIRSKSWWVLHKWHWRLKWSKKRFSHLTFEIRTAKVAEMELDQVTVESVPVQGPFGDFGDFLRNFLGLSANLNQAAYPA